MNEQATRDIAFWEAYGEVITDSTAMAIAAEWQSPNSELATLASRGSDYVDWEDLADAIRTELYELENDGVTADTDMPSARGGWTGDDYTALTALYAYARHSGR